jgi:hypothetical protein
MVLRALGAARNLSATPAPSAATAAGQHDMQQSSPAKETGMFNAILAFVARFHLKKAGQGASSAVCRARRPLDGVDLPFIP